MSPVEIAKQSFLAFTSGDRAANEAVIADDFSFTSPLDNQLDRATYFERCWPNNESISGFEFIRVIGHDNEVIVTYEGTATSGRRFRNTEVLTIENGKIRKVEVYFGWNVPHDAPQGGHIADA